MLIGTQMSEIGDRRWLLDVNQLNHPIGKKSGAIYRTQVGNSYMRALPPPLFYPVFYIVDELPCSPHSHFCQPSGTPKRCSYLHPQKPEIMTETLTTSSTKGTAGFSPDARWATGASFIFEKAASKETAGSITMAVPSDDYDSDEPSPNTTKLLLESHTSTDGSESPKPRWTRGPPPTLKEEPSASTIRSASGEKDAPPSPPTLRSGRAGTSPSGVKSYVAWTWLLEDEGTSEPKLRKPGDGEAVALPQLMDAERELLYQNTRQRLLEVRRENAHDVGQACPASFLAGYDTREVLVVAEGMGLGSLRSNCPNLETRLACLANVVRWIQVRAFLWILASASRGRAKPESISCQGIVAKDRIDWFSYCCVAGKSFSAGTASRSMCQRYSVAHLLKAEQIIRRSNVVRRKLFNRRNNGEARHRFYIVGRLAINFKHETDHDPFFFTLRNTRGWQRSKLFHIGHRLLYTKHATVSVYTSAPVVRVLSWWLLKVVADNRESYDK